MEFNKRAWLKERKSGDEMLQIIDKKEELTL